MPPGSARRIFQEVWQFGVPVVVRGVEKGFDWSPATLLRAAAPAPGRAAMEVRGHVLY